MDIREYNRQAWDKAVEREDRWTIPADPDVIARARLQDWSVVLTPTKPVPQAWFGPLPGKDLLALASSGGQQGPIFAAAGANVTGFDNSPKQLAQDKFVADRDQLSITLVEGDMRDLSIFAPASFDIIFNPCSTCFVDDVAKVWRECYRVLRPNGVLLTGFINPVLFCFDKELENKGELKLRYSLPYSDLESLTDQERRRYTDYLAPIEWSHTLSTQIGAQLEAGLVLTHFYEDTWGGGELVDRYMPGFIATRAKKLAAHETP